MEYSILELQKLIEKIKEVDQACKDLDEKQELTYKDLKKATNLSTSILIAFDGLLTSAKRNRNLDTKGIAELQTFLKIISKQIKMLDKIAKQEVANAPTPHAMVSTFTNAAEGFINSRFVSGKGGRENLKFLATGAGIIPLIETLGLCCHALPYYWPYATRWERVGLMLSILIMGLGIMAVVTLSINPALAMIPSLAIGAAGVLFGSRFGNSLFKFIIEKAQNRYERIEKVSKLSETLDSQREATASFDRKLSKLGKQVDAQHAAEVSFDQKLSNLNEKLDAQNETLKTFAKQLAHLQELQPVQIPKKMFTLNWESELKARASAAAGRRDRLTPTMLEENKYVPPSAAITVFQNSDW